MKDVAHVPRWEHVFTQVSWPGTVFFLRRRHVELCKWSMERNPSVLLVKALLYTQTHLESHTQSIAQRWYSCHSGKLPERYQTVMTVKKCHTVIWYHISCVNKITVPMPLKYTSLCRMFCFHLCSETDRWQISCFRCQPEYGSLKQNLPCSVCVSRFRSQRGNK